MKKSFFITLRILSMFTSSSGQPGQKKNEDHYEGRN